MTRPEPAARMNLNVSPIDPVRLRELDKGDIEVPLGFLENYTQEPRERLNIRTGDKAWDEMPDGTLASPARIGDDL